jgi:hypothetical protein
VNPQGSGHPWYTQLCRRCGVYAKYCPCQHPDVVTLPLWRRVLAGLLGVDLYNTKKEQQ